MTPSSVIPIDKLRTVLEASDEIMRSVVRRDRKATLDTTARHICRFLNAESCAIFTVADDADGYLVMEASFTDRDGDKLTPCPRLKIQSIPGGGLTGHIADKGEVTRLARSQYAAITCIATPNGTHPHLASGVCYSLLGIPMKDHNGNLLGLLKPENKKGLNGFPGDDVVFDEMDEQLARILANGAVVVIESLSRLRSVLEASDEIMRSVVRRDRRATLDTTARHICKFLNAESCAIFSIGDAAGAELTMEAAFTDVDGDKLTDCPALKIQSAPAGGLTGHLASMGTSVRMARPEYKGDIHIARPDGKHAHLASGICYSILAIPMKDRNGKLLGLLKSENKKGLSGVPGDDVRFDEMDEQMARILANGAVVVIESLRAAEAYRKVEEDSAFFSSMVERLEQNVFCKDLQGRFTYVNQRYADRLGRTPSEVIGKTDRDIYTEPVALKFRKDDAEVAATGKPKDVEEVNTERGGERREVRVIKTPIHDSTGKIVGVQGIFWDITERKFYQDFIDQVPDNIYFKDLKIRFRRINKHLAEQFGLSNPMKAIGKKDSDFFTPDHAKLTIAAELKIMETGCPLVGLLENEVYLDGRERHVLTTKLPWRDAHGKIIGTFGISRDVDEFVRGQTLFQKLLYSLQASDASRTAQTLFSGLRAMFGIQAATLYTYDKQNSSFRGTAAFGLKNEDAVRARSFLVGDKSRADTRTRSMVEAVYHLERVVFAEDVDKFPCSGEGAKALGLASGTSAMGLPLRVDKTWLGVMIVYSGGAKRQIKARDEQTLKPYADIFALALSVARAKESLAFANKSLVAQARVLKAQALIARCFGRIAVNPRAVLVGDLGQIAQLARKDFTRIVKHAVELLQAELGALYIADQPVCVNSSDEDDLDKEYRNGTRKFILRAMHKYPPQELDQTSYSPNETALTASVLRTRRPRISPDVQQEADWSKKGAWAFEERFPGSGGMRAWMGVPIFIEHAKRRYLFGAITFTRGRKHFKDNLGFNKAQQKDAVALAKLMALALQSLIGATMELATIAFSIYSAHRMGDPIFTIETNLDPLAKRIRELRVAEALEAVGDIRSSVEQAKSFVRQFKSLARFLEMKPTRTLLFPLLSDSCKSLRSAGIECSLDCPPDLAVWADTERLRECLDELVANAKHWFDKAAKWMGLRVVVPAPQPLPGFLDPSLKYVLFHVEDNGQGIVAANKERVFDLFFSTYSYGTGLGLARVRRIINGHAGGIVERGMFGQGADFQIYLPVPPAQGATEGGGEE